MNPGLPLQAFEEDFSWSDFLNSSDDDDNNLNSTTMTAPSTSMAETSDNMPADDRNGGFDGMVDMNFNFANTSQLPQFVNPMDLQVDVAPVAPTGLGVSNALQAPPVTAPATSSAMDLGSGDVDMVDPFGIPVDTSATYADSLTMSPETQGWNEIDNFQNPFEAGGMLDDFAPVDLVPFVSGVGLSPSA